MSAAGWVKIHRQITENYLWRELPFDRKSAWIDLLLVANYRDGHIRVRGIKVEVKRGQVGYSILTLAARWGWSRGKVTRFLMELQNEHQIVQQNNRLTSLITIVNYESYQCGDTTDEASDQASNEATDRTTDGQQTDTIKKEKKEKKKTSSSDALRLSGILADLILTNNPKHTGLSNGKRESLITSWADPIDKLMRIGNQSPEEIEKVIRFCQADSFWSKNILSGEKLRKQYDTLSVKMSSTSSDSQADMFKGVR